MTMETVTMEMPIEVNDDRVTYGGDALLLVIVCLVAAVGLAGLVTMT